MSEADTVVFVLSPTSARSEICAWEVEEATRLGKRILPVIWRPLEGASPPSQLRERNYIFFHADPRASLGAGFGTGLANLTAALNTDFDWLREHTRYLQRAIEWDRGGRPANRLLSGNDIAEAKAWVARRPKNAPEPTALHLDFIRASEEEADALSSAQRRQLDDMAVAQAEREAALKRAEEAQRKRATIARIRNIAFVAVSILALLTGWLGWRAEQQRNVAEEQKKQADNILASAVRIWVTSANQMDTNTKKAAFSLFQAGADHGDEASMAILGWHYEVGFGVAQDYAKAREWYEKAADNGDAGAKAKLEQLSIHEAFGAGRYAEALQLQEALAAKMEGVETKREGKPGVETAAAFYSVAWYALFAREFTKALTAADRAHAMVPAHRSFEINRAHALMFSGRGEDAMAIYLAHKGEPLSETLPTLWEHVIVEDFAEFRKAGLMDPMMIDVEKELGVSR